MGIWLAQQLGGDVVACDSTQLYQGIRCRHGETGARRARRHPASFNRCARRPGRRDCRRLSGARNRSTGEVKRSATVADFHRRYGPVLARIGGWSCERAGALRAIASKIAGPRGEPRSRASTPGAAEVGSGGGEKNCRGGRTKIDTGVGSVPFDAKAVDRGISERKKTIGRLASDQDWTGA